jgi:hypothetical protein
LIALVAVSVEPPPLRLSRVLDNLRVLESDGAVLVLDHKPLEQGDCDVGGRPLLAPGRRDALHLVAACGRRLAVHRVIPDRLQCSKVGR